MADHCRTSGVDHVALVVPDLPSAADFYVDRWGMLVVARDEERCELATAGARYADLVLLEGPDLALHHIAFAFASAEEVERVLDSLVGAGHEQVRPLGEPDEPGQECSAAVLDPDGITVELVVGRPLVDREPASPLTPVKIGHIVLSSPHRDAMETFYRHLGFVVTDRTAQGMSFLRCNTDHHSLAVATGEGAWLQHIAYDVGTVDAVMRDMATLSGADVRPIWGPGRHGPGNNVFTYYQDPAGTIVERYGELEIYPEMDAPVAVREWGPEHRGDSWGLAGPPPPAFFATGARPVRRTATA